MKIIDINNNERECVSAILDDKWPGYVKVEYESKNRPGLKHFEWYPTDAFLKNNPGMKQIVHNTPLPPKDDLGIVSKCKTLTLIDKKKKWKDNIYRGFPVWISRGKGEGQKRFIISNTKNTLTIDKPWNEIPDSTSQYVISYYINNPKVLGNNLPGKEILQ